MTTLAHLAAPSKSLSTPARVVLMLGALDFGLEQSIILPALPDLADHYSASIIGVAWLSTAFLLASIVAVPLCSRLGDIFGKRLLLLASLATFAAGSLVCALTHSIALAVAGRAIQGLGAAIAPLALGLARDIVSPEHLPRVIGSVVGAANIGSAVGFLLSGVLVDLFSPIALFWFLFLLACTLMACVAAFVPESPVRSRVRVDVAGAVLLASGLVSLLLAISKGTAWGWSSPEIIALFAGAAVLLAVFALVERRVPHPLVDLRLVTTRPFANVNLCAFLFGYAFFVAVIVLPQIAATPEASGYGLGLSTIQIGLLLVPTSVAGFTASWLGGRIVDRVGPRALFAVGALCGIVGYVSLTVEHSTFAALALGSAVIGIGWGFILTGIYVVIMRNATVDKTGVAMGVMVVFRNTAVSTGVTVAFVLISAAGFSGEFRNDAGYTWAFAMCAVGAAISLLASPLLPGRRAVAAPRPAS